MVQTRYPGRELAADLAMPLGALGSVLLAGGLVAIRSDRWRPLVVLVLLVPVAGSALLGGRWPGLVTALVAAASFNFFHLAPYGLLKLGLHQATAALVFVLAALLLARPRATFGARLRQEDKAGRSSR